MKMLKFLLTFVLSASLFLLINTSQVDATEFGYDDNLFAVSDELHEINSAKMTYSKVVYYSLDNYCPYRACYDGKIPFPRRIWVSNSAGYSGSIGIEYWDITNSHYAVRYTGTIRKGQYAPTQMVEENE